MKGAINKFCLSACIFGKYIISNSTTSSLQRLLKPCTIHASTMHIVSSSHVYLCQCGIFLCQKQGQIVLIQLWLVITIPIKIAQIDDKNVSYGRISTPPKCSFLFSSLSPLPINRNKKEQKKKKIKSNPINAIRTVEFVTKLLIYSISFNP